MSRHDERESKFPKTPNIALSMHPNRRSHPVRPLARSLCPSDSAQDVQLACVPRHVPSRLRLIEACTNAHQVVRQARTIELHFTRQC
jgi:hypothetical protein